MRMFEKRWFTALCVVTALVFVFTYLALAGELSYDEADSAMALYHESKVIAREVNILGLSGAVMVGLMIAVLNDMRKENN